MQTAHLQLDAVTLNDLDEHAVLLADPGVWRHLPSGRHTSRAQTEATLRAAVQQWEQSSLGYWSARMRHDLPDAVTDELRPGTFVGTGGCALRPGTEWWNLYYRLRPAAWGRGLAAELVAAARAAATAIDPDLPVVAYLLEHNDRSRLRAERSGLTLAWRGPDAGNPDPGAVRLVYTDRPVSAALLARITGTEARRAHRGPRPDRGGVTRSR